MDSTTMIILVLAVLALIALLFWVSARNKARQAEKRDELRERFGPEYDRAVQEHGDEREAASRLGDVAKTRDKLEIRELSPVQRDRYASDWMEVQAAFVDAPDGAVRDADRLVGSVMRDRGYPVDDFDAKIDMVRADHPKIAENYRAAHAIKERTGSDGTGADGNDGTGTEDLRQAFVHYRVLFAELLGDGQTGQPDRSTAMQDGRYDQHDQHDEHDEHPGLAHDETDRQDGRPRLADDETDRQDGRPRLADDESGQQRIDLTQDERTTTHEPRQR